MKINGLGGIGPIKAYTFQIKKDQAVQQEQKILGDKVEIPKEAMEFKSYLNLIDKLPAVREALVAALKQSIQDGSYQPECEKIAAGIISDRYADKTISKTI